MPSLDRHPNRVIYSPATPVQLRGLPVHALHLNLVQRSIGVRGFGPEAQDQGVVSDQRRSPGSDRHRRSRPLLAAMLAPEWASFPTLAGRSYYGQPTTAFFL